MDGIVACAIAVALGAELSRGKKKIAAADAAITATATTSEIGETINVRMSRHTRRGNVVMGKVVAPPEMMNIAITET
jgi:hypothetical protein